MVAAGASGGGVVGGGGGGAVVVDPRMRARRIGVRRDAGHRRLRRVGLVLGLVALAGAAGAATRSPLLDVDRVEVLGTERSGVADVRAAAGIARGEPMVAIRAGAAAARVEALPWVDRATVGRAWPGTVTIRVTERVPAATVALGTGAGALVDRDGRVLAVRRPAGGDPGDGAGDGPGDGPGAGAPAPQEVPVVTGVGGTLEPGERLGGAARAALRVALAAGERMPGVVASVSTDLDATLVAGGVVRFGGTDDLDRKITAAKTVLEEVDTACLEVLDVRVPGNAALTRNQRCS